MAYLALTLVIIFLIITVALIFYLRKNTSNENLLRKGAIRGGIVGIILWIFGLFLQGNSFFKILTPLCYISGTEPEKFGMCNFFIGHISNIIIFSIIGLLIAWVIEKIKSE